MLSLTAVWFVIHVLPLHIYALNYSYGKMGKVRGAKQTSSFSLLSSQMESFSVIRQVVKSNPATKLENMCRIQTQKQRSISFIFEINSFSCKD